MGLKFSNSPEIFTETSSQTIEVKEIASVTYCSVEYVDCNGVVKKIHADEVVINNSATILPTTTKCTNYWLLIVPQKRIYVEVPDIGAVLCTKENRNER